MEKKEKVLWTGRTTVLALVLLGNGQLDAMRKDVAQLKTQVAVIESRIALVRPPVVDVGTSKTNLYARTR